jgi:predicted Zn-dependent protease
MEQPDRPVTTTPPSVPEIQQALERGEHDAVLRATDDRLASHPGDDAAHELRARALLALGRGEAAEEFNRLARNDPRQSGWTLAEAEERLGAAQPGMGAEAARRAVRLEPRNGQAQLTLSQALARIGDGPGAFRAAGAALRLLGGRPDAREALADARWLTNEDGAAFGEYRALARELEGGGRERVTRKAKTLYGQHAGRLGRLLAAIGPLWELAFRSGWLRV